MSFISFSCLSWTSSIMLNSSGKSGHPFKFLILEGKSMMLLLSMLVVCLPGMALLCWGTFLLYPICQEFLSSFMKTCILSNAFSPFIDISIDHMISIFQTINAVYHTYWFVYVELSLHPRDKSHLIMMYVPFLISCLILLELCSKREWPSQTTFWWSWTRHSSLNMWLRLFWGLLSRLTPNWILSSDPRWCHKIQ